MSADAITRNLRRHDRHYDGLEPNRIAWCAYYREQLIDHGVIIPFDGQSILDDVLAMIHALEPAACAGDLHTTSVPVER